MSREGSLDLLDEVQECLEAMKRTQQIKPVKVKSMLEHLRSSLEYVANDTYDKHNLSSEIERPNIFFPYGKKVFIDNFFTKKLNISPPSSSPLYRIYNSIQSYQTGDNWLEMMCNLTNEVKHRHPIPLQEDEVTKGVKINFEDVNLITISDSSNVVFKNFYVNGKKATDFALQNGRLEIAENGIPLNFVLSQEKKIRFHGVDYEVIPFIEECIKKIKLFINESYDVLEKL
ncbi:hypothetical protein [Atlantibacter hermannii]|uniref:hypothetical protein n=1 Tax=Atlantibacter hermannii TaxID=565 RepID=UPI002FDB3A29